LWEMSSVFTDGHVSYRPRFGHWMLWDMPPPYTNPAQMIEELMGARHFVGEYVDGSLPEDHVAAQWAFARPPWWDGAYRRAKPGTYKDPREPWNQKEGDG